MASGETVCQHCGKSIQSMMGKWVTILNNRALSHCESNPNFRWNHEPARPSLPEEAKPEPEWRVGRKVPLNVYEGDRPVCQCHTVEDALRIVEAMKAARSAQPEEAKPEPAMWRVQYGRFYLNGKLVFDAQRFNNSVDLDQLCQLQQFATAVQAAPSSVQPNKAPK